VGRIGNWRTCIEPWLEEFGRKAISLRIFEERHFVGGSLLSDFACAVGIDLSNAEVGFGRVNPSYSNSVVDLASSLRDLFAGIHDNTFYEMLHDAVGAPALKKPGEHMLTRPQRMAILAHYKASNRWIRDTFFSESNLSEELFATEPIYESQTSPKTRDTAIELLVRIAFNHHRAIEHLKDEIRKRPEQQ
jgi:hypothetical protein